MRLWKQLSKRRLSRRSTKLSEGNDGYGENDEQSLEIEAESDTDSSSRVRLVATDVANEEEEAVVTTTHSMNGSLTTTTAKTRKTSCSSTITNEKIPGVVNPESLYNHNVSTDLDLIPTEQKTASTSEKVEDCRQKPSSKKEKKKQRQRIDEGEALERQELRLGGFEPYVFVSVLSAQASYGELAMIDVNWDKITTISSLSELLEDDWLKLGLLIAAAGSTVAGLYSSVVFSLTILYGKTALGMDRDEEYFGFMNRTGIQRFRAFKAFTWSLFLFLLSVVFEVSMKVGQTAKFPCLVFSSTMLYFLKREYECIIAAAAPMFAPKNHSSTDKDSE